MEEWDVWNESGRIWVRNMGEKVGSRGVESLLFMSHYPHVCISSERQGLHGRGSRSVRSRNPPNAFYSQLILVGRGENFQNPLTAVTGHDRTLRVIFRERTEAQKDDSATERNCWHEKRGRTGPPKVEQVTNGSLLEADYIRTLNVNRCDRQAKVTDRCSG